MSKKKGGETPAVKGSDKSDAAKSETVSYKGRSERIKELVKAGKLKTYDDLLEVIKKEYPGSSPAKVRKVYDSAKAEK